MGSSQSGVPPNDPLLAQNNRQQNLLNSIYSSNASIIPNYSEDHDMVSVEVNPPKVKKTKTYKNPTLLKRDSIKLEQDALNQNMCYVTFEYDSTLDFYVKFHLNAVKNTNHNIPENFLSGPGFSDLSNNSGVLVKSGMKQRFSDSLVAIDMDNFLRKKQVIPGSTDLIIELISVKENNAVECVLATLCKLILERVNRSEVFKVHVESQKLNVKGNWYEMHDVYGLTSEANNNECEICCASKKNTIFLPCKHSYACNACAQYLRRRNNPCPICRSSINDLLIIENDEGKKKDEGNEATNNIDPRK